MRLEVVIVIVFVAFQNVDCHGGVPTSRLNFFDLDLLKHTTENKRGNVMVSPASIKTTLAMLLEGANGVTANEIKNALRVSPDKDDFRDELSSFVDALQADTTNSFLRNANALFLSRKLKLKREYEWAATQIYHSEIRKLDFSNTKASVDSINTWVYEKTRGLIPTIVEEVQIPPLTEMMVANALYFKSAWKYSFNSKSTHSDCFYNKGLCKKVAMMDLQAELNYAFVDDLRAHALELPYQSGRYSMIILVPQDRDADDALIRDLPFIGLPRITELLEPIEVTLTLPKFNVEYHQDMVGVLQKIRINSLFSQYSNLTGIYESGENNRINSIYHSVRMKVDEEGTVAAAATASLVVPLINDQVQLRVDRPFLFFIKDNKFGIVLFEGRIDDPTEYREKDQSLPKPSNHQPSTSSRSQGVPRRTYPIHVDNGDSTFIFPSIDSKSNFESGSDQLGNIQPTVKETTQSEPVTTEDPIKITLISTSTERAEEKRSGISSLFHKIRNYF